MKIAKHLTFYFIPDKIFYINKIIDETNKYDYTTDIFIHTNNINLEKKIFNNYTNGYIKIIYHDLSNISDHGYLTWKCRELLCQQRNEYDIFMYSEDDILVPHKAIKYWLKYNKILIDSNYNLGFLRTEVENNIEYVTDLLEILDTTINLNETKYAVNNKNPYCAFWIYNKDEFNNFINSKYYNLNNIQGYGIPERSAVGLHGLHTKYYLNTLIPIVDNKLIEDCKIYHMTNKFVLDKTTPFGTIKFDEALKIDEAIKV